MLVVKCFISIFVLYLVHPTECKPAEDYVTEGRGVGSTLWGWITYPFSWWSSEPEQPPFNYQLIGSSPYTPYDNIEIVKRNVTVWCNDQTCTTMKCDKFGCKNVTCSIYDTDMRGECREYNTAVKPEEPPSKPTLAPPVSTTDQTTHATKAPEPSTSVPTTTSVANSNQPLEERPLELEAVLSSTVTEANVKKGPSGNKINRTSSPQNKV